MSEMNENKLSMLISEPMEAQITTMGSSTTSNAMYSTMTTKAASVSLDAGPLQRV